jgi:hypothetical protein
MPTAGELLDADVRESC